MDYQGLNSVEYQYEKRVEGKYRLSRVLYTAAAVLFSFALMFAVCAVGGPFVYTVPVIFMICLIVFRYLFMYFQIGYKYKIEGGVFTAYIVYNSTRIKEYYKADLRAVKCIKPYDALEKVSGTVYPSCISLKKPTPELYQMNFTNGGGVECVAYFEATKNTLKVMKYFHEETVIAQNVRH